MTVRVGINGFGRIGRNFWRAAQASGKDLKWFWAQWIEGAQFPKVGVVSARSHRQRANWITRVSIKQRGTAAPFKLRLAVRLSGNRVVETPVVLTEAEHTYSITTPFKPAQASINPNPTALVSVDGSVAVGG